MLFAGEGLQSEVLEASEGIDALPIGRFLRTPPTRLVIDDGRYRTAVADGAPDRQPLFTGYGGKVTWEDGSTEEVDTILPATGHRPDLGYLAPLGALDEHGHPLHREGASMIHPGLAYVGLEWQRSLSSNSLRGVGRDAVRGREPPDCPPARPLTLGTPGRTGSTCVNIDVCRMCRC